MLSLGIIPYLNALPLTRFLTRTCGPCRLRSAVPSRTAAWVRDRRVDAALVPVAELLASPELVSLGDAGICAEGPVTSVLLQTRCPLGELRSLHPDPASRTSNRLAEVLWRRAWGHTTAPRLTADPRSADACVLIGDRALRTPRQPGTVDLAEVWHDLTALPFVFAVWATHRDHPRQQFLAEQLCAARDLGLRHLDRLIQEATTGGPWTPIPCRRYLAENLHYRVGPRERKALARFARWAGQIPPAANLQASPEAIHAHP